MPAEPTLDEKIAAAKKVYERDGVATIPGLFSKDEVNGIRASAMMSLLRADSSSSSLDNRLRLQTRTVDMVEFPALLFWPARQNFYLDEIRRDPRIAAVVQSFLGDNIRQLNNQIYFRLPGDKDEFAWHQDISFRTPEEDFDRIEERYLQTLIVVDEITEENGAVEYIPGSHKLGDQNLIPRDGCETGLREFRRSDRYGVKYTAKPGDFMIWSVMVVHGSERNRTSDRPRMTYMNGFAQADAVRPGAFPYYMIDGKTV